MNGIRVSRRLASVAAIAALCLAILGCGQRLAESDVPYAASLLDNVLTGLAERDYGKFSTSFSPAMKEALGEGAFPSMVAQLEKSLGEYKGRTFLRAVRARAATGGKVDVVTYRAEFSRDSGATIRIYISDRDGKKMVEGLAVTPSGGAKI